jgi:hypothetical protein
VDDECEARCEVDGLSIRNPPHNIPNDPLLPLTINMNHCGNGMPNQILHIIKCIAGSPSNVLIKSPSSANNNYVMVANPC